MKNEQVTSAVEAIHRQYKSLDSPDYTFQRKSMSRNPYAPLVAEFSKAFAIEDITDGNDDVSFHYVLTRNGQEWAVELSMVGPYANVFRLTGYSSSKLLTGENAAPEDMEILTLVANAGLAMLSQAELETPIPLKLFSTDPGRVKIYQALFSDIDVLPWEGPAASPWSRVSAALSVTAAGLRAISASMRRPCGRGRRACGRPFFAWLRRDGS